MVVLSLALSTGVTFRTEVAWLEINDAFAFFLASYVCQARSLFAVFISQRFTPVSAEGNLKPSTVTMTF